MALLQNKRTLLAKIETTYGDDPTPTGAANAILVRNMNITPQQAQQVGRDVIRPYLGNSEQLPSSIHALIDFEVEMAGSGAAGTAPAYGPLLRGCGFAETVSAGVDVVYAPVSASFESVALYFNVDGVLHKLTGGRGTVSAELAVDQIPVFKFKFTGLYNAVVDAAAPSVTLTGWKQPLPVNRANTSGFSLHAYANGLLQSLSLDAANDVQFRSLVGGNESVLITNRKPAGNLSMEATTIAAKDWFSAAKNATLDALSITHGTTAGYKVKLDAPKVQLTNPTYAESQGIAMLNMGLVLVPNTSNDELIITVL